MTFKHLLWNKTVTPTSSQTDIIQSRSLEFKKIEHKLKLGTTWGKGKKKVGGEYGICKQIILKNGITISCWVFYISLLAAINDIVIDWLVDPKPEAIVLYKALHSGQANQIQNANWL